jgi:hypothetical protein
VVVCDPDTGLGELATIMVVGIHIEVAVLVAVATMLVGAGAVDEADEDVADSVEIITVGTFELLAASELVKTAVVDASVAEVIGTTTAVLFSEAVLPGNTVTDDASTVVDADSVAGSVAVAFEVEADVGRMRPDDVSVGAEAVVAGPVIPETVSIVEDAAVVAGPVIPETVSMEEDAAVVAGPVIPDVVSIVVGAVTGPVAADVVSTDEAAEVAGPEIPEVVSIGAVVAGPVIPEVVSIVDVGESVIVALAAVAVGALELVLSVGTESVDAGSVDTGSVEAGSVDAGSVIVALTALAVRVPVLSVDAGSVTEALALVSVGALESVDAESVIVGRMIILAPVLDGLSESVVTVVGPEIPEVVSIAEVVAGSVMVGSIALTAELKSVAIEERRLMLEAVVGIEESVTVVGGPVKPEVESMVSVDVGIGTSVSVVTGAASLDVGIGTSVSVVTGAASLDVGVGTSVSVVIGARSLDVGTIIESVLVATVESVPVAAPVSPELLSSGKSVVVAESEVGTAVALVSTVSVGATEATPVSVITV